MKTLDFSLGGVDKVFRTPGSAAENKHIVILPLAELHQHPQLKVEVRQDAYLDELTESIKQNGLLEEVRAFPDPDGGYWIISGRHRCMAARKAGLSEVPVILDDTMTQETAEIAITDCNLRHELGTMEKAWTYRIKREAESRQGHRSDLQPRTDFPTSCREVPSESERTIQRYIRLTYLVPELQAMVDQEKAPLKVGVGEALSYLSGPIQTNIASWIRDYDKTPSLEIAEEWKKRRENLSSDDVLFWFAQRDKPQKTSFSVSLPYSQIAASIPAGYGKKQIADLMQELLTEWAEKNEVVSEDPFPELKVGEYVEGHGELLTWDELRIGMKVIYNASTVSHEWFKIMQVEKFTRLDNGEDRVILQDGVRSRSYINRSHIDKGQVLLYRPMVQEANPAESQIVLNSPCKTGMSLSGHCGAAHYCDQPYDCCLKCPESCNGRCGCITEHAETGTSK